MSQRRNLLIVLALAALLIVALLLIGSLLSDVTGLAALPSATPTVVTDTPTPLPTHTPTETATVTITMTPTVIPSLTPMPTSTATATATPTLTPRPRVYLSPFSQVFAVGQAQPNNSTQVLMYEGSSDSFDVLGTQGPFTELQTTDRGMNFWTATTSILAAPQPPPQYDYSVRGRTARLYSGSIFACAHSDRPTLAFGACQALNGISSAALIARVTIGSGTVLYLAEIGGAQYLIPSSAVLSIS